MDMFLHIPIYKHNCSDSCMVIFGYFDELQILGTEELQEYRNISNVYDIIVTNQFKISLPIM